MNTRTSKLSSLRLLTVVLGLTELVGLCVLVATLNSGGDSLGIGKAVSLLITIPTLMLVAPALLLAWLNKAVTIAFALVILVLPVAFALWCIA